MTAKVLVEMKNVSKKFEGVSGEYAALKDLSLQITAGEMLAIMGKSGSGKSTLLNMLTGIDHPSAGSVAINGTAIHSLDESRLASWRGANVGIVFQFFQLIPTLTILENIILAMDFVDVIPKKKRRQRAIGLLALVDIAPHANKLPAALSGGEQQRAAIARALANDPPILIADEPTGNLDSQMTQDIQSLFIQLAEQGKTVVVVTHDDISDAGYDRVLTLKDGMLMNEKVMV